MGLKQYQAWADQIESEIKDMMRTGFAKGAGKKNLTEEAASKIFRTHFFSEASICGEGVFIIRHILIGGISAAKELEWLEKKATKQLCIGLLNCLCDFEKDFILSSSMLVRGAVQAALLANQDPCAMTEDVIGAILKVGKTKVYKTNDLMKSVARAAVAAGNAFPQKEASNLKEMMFSLLDGKLKIS